MPGEMRAAHKNFFCTTSFLNEEVKLLPKIWAFLEKTNCLLFFRFADCGPFKGGPGANVSNTFLPSATLLGSSIYCLKLHTLG